MADRVSVLIVDDDPLVRAGLRLLLDGDQIAVIGEAADGGAAVEQVGALGPDVVLMDIRMPGVDGLAATEAIRAQPGAPEIVVLTTFEADELVLRALEVGAAGFLLKDTPPEEIVASVQRVAAGEAQLSPSVLKRLIARVVTANPDSVRARELLRRLTERELDVARAVAEGLSNAEIGARLYLSVPTVKSHVTALFAKLEVHNRVQVALVVHDADER